MRFAAAEVRLQLDNGVAPIAIEAQDRLRQQPPQPFGQKRATEELGRVLVFVRAFALIHLPQVGGKLRLLIPSAGDVGMRRHDFSPRFQPSLRLPFGRLECLFPHLRAALFIEQGPHQVHAHLTDFSSRIGGGHRVQQPFHRVEGANGVVAAELLVVGPVVANVPQLTDDAPLGMPQRILEDGIPLIPENAEQRLRIVEVDRLRLRPPAARAVLRQDRFPVVAQLRLQFSLDKRTQTSCQQVQPLADSFTVRDCHCSAVHQLKSSCCVEVGRGCVARASFVSSGQATTRLL